MNGKNEINGTERNEQRARNERNGMNGKNEKNGTERNERKEQVARNERNGTERLYIKDRNGTANKKNGTFLLGSSRNGQHNSMLNYDFTDRK